MQKDIAQINGYARLIVRELHQVVMDNEIWSKMKTVLALTEELEMYLEGLSCAQPAKGNNVVPFVRKIA